MKWRNRTFDLSAARPGHAARLFVGSALLLTALLPDGLGAQIPGGRSVNYDRERATFRTSILNQIRPVMEAWEGAWRGDVGPTVESLYSPDAVVAVRDSILGGRQALADFAQSARSEVGALVPSLLDFDASDKLAYVYGAWSATAPQGGIRATGRLVTVLRKDGEGWKIRSQLFSAD
jgi:ketosteroid isomerase-like protein